LNKPTLPIHKSSSFVIQFIVVINSTEIRNSKNPYNNKPMFAKMILFQEGYLLYSLDGLGISLDVAGM
jgi:hypothetical protein